MTFFKYGYSWEFHEIIEAFPKLAIAVGYRLLRTEEGNSVVNPAGCIPLYLKNVVKHTKKYARPLQQNTYPWILPVQVVADDDDGDQLCSGKLRFC